MKKLLCIILAAVMLAACSVSVFAAGENTGAPVVFTYDNREIVY